MIFITFPIADDDEPLRPRSYFSQIYFSSLLLLSVGSVGSTSPPPPPPFVPSFIFSDARNSMYIGMGF